METKTVLKRMRYSTWRRIRGLLKAKKGESAADYFERIANFMQYGIN